MASSEQIAKEYYDKGINLIHINSIELAIDNLNMAKTIYEELDDSTNLILTMRGLATAYGIIGFDSKMLHKCLYVFDYVDKKKIQGAKHYFYSIICNRYMMLGDYDSAINYGKMAMQDLEDFGSYFENGPKSYLVACLNLTYSYLHVHRFNEAQSYLSRATEIATKNDIHYYDFSISILNASLHHQTGDDQYIYDHIDDYAGFMKSNEVTVESYLSDLKLLIETFCSMKEFTRAEAVVQHIDSTATISNDHILKLQAAKLYMLVYKQSEDNEKYHNACVRYAEDSIAFENAKAADHLLEMDTSIALSIADTPIELI